MIFTQLCLPGAWLIEPERIEDERGFFARSFCEREFEARGLCAPMVQCNISYNRCQGILRGMHYQTPPHAEAKLVRCTRGAIYDVILDLRPGSATFGGWTHATLDAESRAMLYVPPGVAHGFQTLVDDTEVFYQMSAAFQPDAARGVRWDDSAFSIAWPLPHPILSERDRTFPDYDLGNTRSHGQRS